MTDTSTIPSWLRTALRLPRHLYDRGWGPLLGHRFLLLTHTGRRSGREYGTVLEVVRLDRRSRELVVVSGFGGQADWLRNLRAGGAATVTVGRHTFRAAYRVLGLDEAVAVFADYERRNRLVRPILRAVLTRLLGWHYRGTDEDRGRLARQLPLIAVRPAGGDDPDGAGRRRSAPARPPG